MAGGMPPRGGLGPSGSGVSLGSRVSPRASIELSGLTKRFGEIAVDNIDLTVASGEFFSLLGPSGCGKTTTLRLIAGFEQPTSARSCSTAPMSPTFRRTGATSTRCSRATRCSRSST